MIHSVGADIVSVSKVTALRVRHGQRVHEAVFTEAEANECRRLVSAQPLADGDETTEEKYYATRFAAKEAVLKALRVGPVEAFEFSDIEVLGMANVTIKLHGPLAGRTEDASIHSLTGSVSSTQEHAVAIVIGEGNHDT